jgi:ABC-2 type transport system permease protein
MNTPSPGIASIDSAWPMPAGRVLRAYLVEAKYTLLSMLRTPVFLVPMLALPVFLYPLIGTMVFSQEGANEPNVGVFIFSGFLVFAVSGPGMFGFGVGLAIERQYGVLDLKRAQPMPPGANLLAKMIAAMASSGIVMSLLITLALWLGHVHFAPNQVVMLVLVSMLGVLPFCAIGFLIGTLVSGSAAPGIVNLIYFPMLYLSGMFFPLPEFLQTWALIWPTFYLNQLVWSAAGVESVINAKICTALLLGITVLCTGIAARRLSRVG